jgi:hypothetical protein
VQQHELLEAEAAPAGKRARGSGGGVRAGVAGGKALSLEAAGKRAMRGGDDDEAVTAAADAQVLNGALIEPFIVEP